MSTRYDIIPNIATAIAEVEGTAPTDLEYTLFEYIDPDAIKILVESRHTDWELTFQVPDHTVTIRGEGAILVDDEHVHNFGEE